MAPIRVAVGVLAALVVLGAVVHFQPTHKLTSASLVSAALDVETLPACKAQNPMTAGGTDGAPVYAVAGIGQNSGWPCTDGAPMATCPSGELKAKDTLYVEKDGPCVCGNQKKVCTNGRVCDETGEGQCYLPRCPAKDSDVPRSYSAGCFCADDAAFTSSNPAKVLVATGPAPGDCEAAAKTTDGGAATTTTAAPCKCGTKSYCDKGMVCCLTTECATSGVCLKEGAAFDHNPKTLWQKYSGAVPSIKSNVFTKATDFAICKSTVLKTVRCIPPTGIAPTQEGQPVAPKCEVQ